MHACLLFFEFYEKHMIDVNSFRRREYQCSTHWLTLNVLRLLKKKVENRFLDFKVFFFFEGPRNLFYFSYNQCKIAILNNFKYQLILVGCSRITIHLHTITFYVIIPSIISSKDAVNHACFTLFHQLTTFYSLFSLSLPLSLTHTHTHKLLQPKYRLFNFVVKLLYPYHYSFCKNKTIGITIS